MSATTLYAGLPRVSSRLISTEFDLFDFYLMLIIDTTGNIITLIDITTTYMLKCQLNSYLPSNAQYD